MHTENRVYFLMKKQTPKLSPLAIMIIEGFSWYGVLAILGAYAVTTLGIYPPSSYLVIFLNISGALAMLFDAWKDKNWQPVFLNIIWIALGLVAAIQGFI